MKWISHRGESFDAPENSLAAFKKSAECGLGVELDVQPTKDGKIVVFHDGNVKRMCGVDKKISEMTFEEVSALRLNESEHKIPLFSEVLDVLGDVPVSCEIKTDGAAFDTDFLENTYQMLKEYKGDFNVISFNPFVLEWFKNNHPEVIRGQLSQDFSKEEKYKGKVLYLLLTNLMLNVLARPDFIAYKHQDASQISRRICRKLGALSVTWTIKSKEDYEKVKDDFDLFIFDSCRL